METRSEMKLSHTLAVCVLGMCLLGVSAHAELYIFGQVTGGSMDLCPDAFTMEVVEQGDQALFTFTNNCDSDGVLGRIFFMENDLMVFNSIDDQPDGVSFSAPIKQNAMLPGGHPIGFTPHNTYSINADPARPKNGLHYEDYVSILFDLTGGTSFDDIIVILPSPATSFMPPALQVSKIKAIRDVLKPLNNIFLILFIKTNRNFKGENPF